MSLDVHFQVSRGSPRKSRCYVRPREQSRSFVRQFLQCLYPQIAELSQTALDITNTSKTVGAVTGTVPSLLICGHPGLDSYDDTWWSSEAIGNIDDGASDEKGIVIGTGTTAVAVNDFKLATQIAHGSSAAQMVHYGCWGLNYTTGASSASFDIERIFRNDSGGSIVVAEIGIYSGGYNSTNVFNSFCIIRDVLGATVTVLNGEYLKVKYTITVSV